MDQKANEHENNGELKKNNFILALIVGLMLALAILFYLLSKQWRRAAEARRRQEIELHQHEHALRAARTLIALERTINRTMLDAFSTPIGNTMSMRENQESERTRVVENIDTWCPAKVYKDIVVQIRIKQKNMRIYMTSDEAECKANAIQNTDNENHASLGDNQSRCNESNEHVGLNLEGKSDLILQGDENGSCSAERTQRGTDSLPMHSCTENVSSSLASSSTAPTCELQANSGSPALTSEQSALLLVTNSKQPFQSENPDNAYGRKSSEIEYDSYTKHFLRTFDSAAEFDANSGCVICFEDFVPSSIVRYLPCHHLFHRTCIDSWFQRSSLCPLCLHDFATITGNPPASPDVAHGSFYSNSV